MGTKVHHTIPPIPGIKDAHDFLELVNNKEKLAKVINHLESLRKEANDAIKNRYKADKIDEILDEASADKQKAKFEIATANTEATRIITETRENAEKVRNELNTKQIKLKEREDSLIEAQKISNDEINTLSESLEKREVVITENEVRLAGLLSTNNKLKTELKDKLSRLKKAAEEIRG